MWEIERGEKAVIGVGDRTCRFVVRQSETAQHRFPFVLGADGCVHVYRA